MIISQSEIVDLEESIQEDIVQRRHEKNGTSEYYWWENESPGLQYLYQHPHLLLALGYDEYRLLDWSEKNIRFIEKAFPRVEGVSFPLEYESLYRNEQSGEWQLFQGLMPSKEKKANLALNFVGSQKDQDILTSDLLKALKSISHEPRADPTSLILPGLWTPEKQALARIELVDATREIIKAISQNVNSLLSVKWRTLEEIVAELLRAQGMQIYLTPRSGDGGRDIIARGELIPGEPMTIAVEVKKKPTVGVGDVRSALYANRNYPGLMIATAGNFSAGVIKEKRENSLRLFLKDGVALRQWIDLYEMKNSI